METQATLTVRRLNMENATIVYMTRKNDLWLLNHSIYFLYLNFNRQANYPVTIFHDDLTLHDISNLMSNLNNALGFMPNIKFEKLQFSLPSTVSEDPSRYSPSLTQFRMGYRHMCRFYAGQIFNHPALEKYKWYMRLDSDSFILSKIHRDPFRVMQENKYQYSFIQLVQDADWACIGLWDTTKKFMEENKNSLVCREFDWNLELYNTNFEIVDIDFFRTKEYQDYFRYLDSTDNIFYHRWGDHAIRYLGMKMFMEQTKIWECKDFCYQHGGDIQNKELMDINSVNLEPEPFKSIALAAYEKIEKIK